MRSASGQKIDHVQLDGVSKLYEGPRGPVVALNDVDLRVRPGDFTVVSGPSGSGKTTLLLIAAGLISPTSGHVFWGRGAIAALSDVALSSLRASSIGVTLQGADLVGTLTALENVALPALIAGHDEGMDRAREMLALVLPSEKHDSVPRQMSGGERRRVALARALVAGGRFILADEPTADLDAGTTGRVVDVLRAASSRGVGVLVTTHDSLVAEGASARYSLTDGHLEGEG